MTGPIDAMAKYRAEIRTMDPLAFECIGFYGYGNGRVLAANISGGPLDPMPGPVVDGREATRVVGGCNACERVGDCWTATRDKAREMFPDLMAICDRLVDEGARGIDYMNRWFEETGQTGDESVKRALPPDMHLSVENTSHGSFHTAGQRYNGPAATS